MRADRFPAALALLAVLACLTSCGRTPSIERQEALARLESARRQAALEQLIDLGALAPVFGSGSPLSRSERRSGWEPLAGKMAYLHGQVVRVRVRRVTGRGLVWLATPGGERVEVHFAAHQARALEGLKPGQTVQVSGILGDDYEDGLRQGRLE